jgi:ribosome-associated toxin RatA of RatAB toxin-antitoxin module
MLMIGALALPCTVLADGADAETTRLMQSHATERYNVAVAGQSIRAGGGMTAVNAPLSVVRQIVTDFGHYADFMPRFQKSRIVGKSAAGTDVYLQVPILHGAATVWAVTRFGSPVHEGNGERIEGQMNGQGNVDDMRAVWHLHPVDDTHTILKAEILIVPKLPLPGSVVTPELEYAADQAVSAVRDRAETNARKTASAPETSPQ